MKKPRFNEEQIIRIQRLGLFDGLGPHVTPLLFTRREIHSPKTVMPTK